MGAMDTDMDIIAVRMGILWLGKASESRRTNTHVFAGKVGKKKDEKQNNFELFYRLQWLFLVFFQNIHQRDNNSVRGTVPPLYMTIMWLWL